MMINNLPGFGLRALAKASLPQPGATYRIRSVPDYEGHRSRSLRESATLDKAYRVDLTNRQVKLRAALSRTHFTEQDDGKFITFTVREHKP